MKYYTFKYRRRKKIRRLTIVSIFCLFVLAVLLYLENVVNPVVVNLTRQEIFSLSTSAVSDAVYDVLSDSNITYDDLVEVEYNGEDMVSVIHLNTVKLNVLARQFYQVAQNYLNKMGQNGVNIPLGAFTGLPFLSGVGPKVNIKLVPVGAMSSNFESSFLSAGINQTNHLLYINLNASVSLVLPAYSSTIDSVTEVLVTESVIVGAVPEVYMSGESSLSYCPNLN